MKYLKCESKKFIEGILTIIVANKINQLKAICVFVFMINFNMQFIGDVY